MPLGPEARYEQTESISLAFVTALQVLPPRQLAVLILRDVLGFHANEVAGSPSDSPSEDAIVAKFVRAWESADLDALVAGPNSAGRPPPCAIQEGKKLRLF